MRQIRTKTELRRAREAFESEHPPACELAFLLQDWDDGYNVGGMFRVAAACRAKELLLVGRTPKPESDPRIGVTSLGMHRRVPFRTFSRWDEAALSLKQEGYALVAVEVADDAICYREFSYPAKTCLVLGNEGAGITPGLLRSCEAAVMIPMYGKGRSLNVHVAAAIVAFEAVLRA